MNKAKFKHLEYEFGDIKAIFEIDNLTTKDLIKYTLDDIEHFCNIVCDIPEEVKKAKTALNNYNFNLSRIYC